jgi:XTP/dITP diphosphohydrolase
MSAPIEFLFATGNSHKVAELQALADTFRPRVLIRGAREAGGMPPVVEDAGTFAGNAAKKARVLHVVHPGAWVLADDSGLCVDALDGAPGVESANYAGPAAPGAANIAKLLCALDGVPTARRGAHFVCVLYVVLPDGREFGFKGQVDGVILEEPSGAGGFGYDPVFQPTGYRKSFAELGADVKNTISHRGRAWAQLCRWLRAGGG